MSIEIEKTFTIAAPPSAVWAFLTDPEKVASCLPGTSVSEQVDERTYKGQTHLKVGPVAATYKGKMTFERLDEAAGEAEMKATGQDVSGRGGATMRMSSKLVANADGGTDVTVTSRVDVMGILAQMGRGMIQDVSDVLFEQFTEAMTRQLVGPEPEAGAPQQTPAAGAQTSEPVFDAAQFGAKVARRTMARTLTSPLFWIAIAVLAALVWWLSR